MSSLICELAEAVVFELAQHEFSLPFEPKMLVLPEFTKAELQTLRVTVVPHTLEVESVSRSSSKYVAGIYIGIQRRIEGTPEETVASLGALVDEIAEFLQKTELQKFPAAQWKSTSYDPVYVPEHLQQKLAFTSILVVKYVMLGD